MARQTPSVAAAQNSLAPRKIFLTRHGQSEYNRTAQLGGDTSITADGQRYAQLLPALLLSRLAHVDPCSTQNLAVWTSTLKRTAQTARHLPFPKLQWEMLDEINAGMFDGWTYAQIEQHMPEEFAARKKDKLGYRYPGGESYVDLIQRLQPIIAEMDRLAKQSESVVIVCHQAVLRVLYGHLMGIPQEKVPRLEMPLHTLIELTPQADGSYHEQRFPVDVSKGLDQLAPPSPVLAPPQLSMLCKAPARLEEEARELRDLSPDSDASSATCALQA